MRSRSLHVRIPSYCTPYPYTHRKITIKKVRDVAHLPPGPIQGNLEAGETDLPGCASCVSYQAVSPIRVMWERVASPVRRITSADADAGNVDGRERISVDVPCHAMLLLICSCMFQKPTRSECDCPDATSPFVPSLISAAGRCAVFQLRTVWCFVAY